MVHVHCVAGGWEGYRPPQGVVLWALALRVVFCTVGDVSFWSRRPPSLSGLGVLEALDPAGLRLRLVGDEVLRDEAVEVPVGVVGAPGTLGDRFRWLVAHMFDVMAVEGGVGLAAPQVGVPLRLFVFDVDGVRGGLVNPVLTPAAPPAPAPGGAAGTLSLGSAQLGSAEGAGVFDEGCLSVPGVLVPVWRPPAVSVSGLTITGVPVQRVASGMLARVFQHELDHLDGVLVVDHLPPRERREALRVAARTALKRTVTRQGS